MTHSEEETTIKTTSTMEGAPVSPNGSSDANHNVNKPLLASSSSSSSSSSCSSSFTANNKTIKKDNVVASRFLPALLLLPPQSAHVSTLDRPEDDIEEAEIATEPEDDEEDETTSLDGQSPTPLHVTQRIKYAHALYSIHQSLYY